MLIQFIVTLLETTFMINNVSCVSHFNTVGSSVLTRLRDMHIKKQSDRQALYLFYNNMDL